MITGLTDERSEEMSVSALESYKNGVIKKDVRKNPICSNIYKKNSIRDPKREKTGVYFFFFSEDALSLCRFLGYDENFYKKILRPSITEYDIDVELLAENIALGIYKSDSKFALEFALLEEELNRYLDSNGKHACITGRIAEIPYYKSNDYTKNAQILQNMQRKSYAFFEDIILPEVKELIGAHINFGNEGFYYPYSEPYPVEEGIKLLKKLDTRI
jgi:hypothetical protein